MPVTSGAQVLEMIRSEPGTAHIPVIFLTGKDDSEGVRKEVYDYLKTACADSEQRRQGELVNLRRRQTHRR